MLARRAITLGEEISEIDALLKPLVNETAPQLVGALGIGTDAASALLVSAGDNPQRLRNEAAFAHLCGVSPIEASSGKQTRHRHRLNRSGDRQANSALWHIVITRMVYDPRTAPEYIERRTSEGLSKKEAMRCLKRYVARGGLQPPTSRQTRVLTAHRSIVLGRGAGLASIDGVSDPLMDKYPLPIEGGDCPVCGHPEARHSYWSPDTWCDGWSFCEVKECTTCWRSWAGHPPVAG